jgi:hypothetical protein
MKSKQNTSNDDKKKSDLSRYVWQAGDLKPSKPVKK